MLPIKINKLIKSSRKNLNKVFLIKEEKNVGRKKNLETFFILIGLTGTHGNLSVVYTHQK